MKLEQLHESTERKTRETYKPLDDKDITTWYIKPTPPSEVENSNTVTIRYLFMGRYKFLFHHETLIQIHQLCSAFLSLYQFSPATCFEGNPLFRCCFIMTMYLCAMMTLLQQNTYKSKASHWTNSQKARELSSRIALHVKIGWRDRLSIAFIISLTSRPHFPGTRIYVKCLSYCFLTSLVIYSSA